MTVIIISEKPSLPSQPRARHGVGLMTEVEQFQRFTRCIATMPPHVAETLAVFLEWQIEQIEEQERAAPGSTLPCPR
jgi:hypothetical protein